MTRAELIEGIERFRPALLRKARTYDYRNADDLLQDSIVKALRTSRLPHGPDLLSWMETVIRRTYLDAQRKARRTPIPIGLTAPPTPLRLEYDPRGTTISAADAAAGPEEAVWFRLIADGYSRAEIAAVSGRTVHAVRARLYTARARVRETVARAGMEEL
jgi:RNA polymerase sigma-70 factor (ECF subfamily)